jgi:hypothetical protein
VLLAAVAFELVPDADERDTVTHDRKMSSVLFGRRRSNRVFAATSGFHRLGA